MGPGRNLDHQRPTGAGNLTYLPPVPDQGQVVEVRGATWAVADVREQCLPRSPADESQARADHAVTLQSLAEDRLGDELSDRELRPHRLRCAAVVDVAGRRGDLDGVGLSIQSAGDDLDLPARHFADIVSTFAFAAAVGVDG